MWADPGDNDPFTVVVFFRRYPSPTTDYYYNFVGTIDFGDGTVVDSDRLEWTTIQGTPGALAEHVYLSPGPYRLRFYGCFLAPFAYRKGGDALPGQRPPEKVCNVRVVDFGTVKWANTNLFGKSTVEIVRSPGFNNFGDTTLAGIDNVSSAFDGTEIKSIPEGYLDSLTPGVRYFRSYFARCANLEEVPENLFDFVQTSSPVFEYAFLDCPSLKHAPALWEYFPNAIGTNCFTGCDQVDNWNDIPDSWK